jgi:hypothetical protein
MMQLVQIAILGREPTAAVAHEDGGATDGLGRVGVDVQTEQRLPVDVPVLIALPQIGEGLRAAAVAGQDRAAGRDGGVAGPAKLGHPDDGSLPRPDRSGRLHHR